MIFKFVCDWFARPDADRSQPLFVVEVGSGHGKLAYLVARKLLEYKEFFPEHEVKVPVKVRRPASRRFHAPGAPTPGRRAGHHD